MHHTSSLSCFLLFFPPILFSIFRFKYSFFFIFHLLSFSTVDPPPPSDVTAVQDCLTSIRVTWTPPSPLGNTTGYRISYTGGGGSSGSVDVDGGNTNSHTLMGLTNGETYTILIVATSSYGLELGPPLSAGDIYLCNA